MRASTYRPASQRKTADILIAARTEFLANGFSASSIEAIALRAGVSKVTIYSRFKDKGNLFGEVVKSEFEHMRKNLVVQNMVDKSLRDILIFAAQNILDFLMRDEIVRFERILSVEVNRDPEIGEFFLENGPRFVLEGLTNLFQVAVKKGEIQSEDVGASAEMFVGLVIGRIDLFLRYGKKINMTAKEKRKRVIRAVDAWLLIHQA